MWLWLNVYSRCTFCRHEYVHNICGFCFCLCRSSYFASKESYTFLLCFVFLICALSESEYTFKLDQAFPAWGAFCGLSWDNNGDILRFAHQPEILSLGQPASCIQPRRNRRNNMAVAYTYLIIMSCRGAMFMRFLYLSAFHWFSPSLKLCWLSMLCAFMHCNPLDR